MATEYKIRILPRKETINAAQGMSLLEALMGSGIFLRSDCGGKGSCGKCRVNIVSEKGRVTAVNACRHLVDRDMTVEIPSSSLSSSCIMDKACVSFPPAFRSKAAESAQDLPYGVAVDLGTTTIAVYLCRLAKREVISSIALKNPQALYGADVMSRISAVTADKETLKKLQQITVKGIQWGIRQLLSPAGKGNGVISRMVVVGNPTMVHILTGTDPKSIGVAPYQPVFHEARQFDSRSLGFDMACFQVRTLPNVAGFLGGDILAAAQAADMEAQPDGTLLVDLGTNGELLLKHGHCLFATSCATGPAFEGATLACGIQAVPGAVNGVEIDETHRVTKISTVSRPGQRSPAPTGICGAGVINAVAQFCRKGIIQPSGAFESEIDRFTLVPENPGTGQPAIYISQKDIRSVQLGKSALITGIEFLLKEAGLNRPEKLIIAGAFGAYLNKLDLIRLGMIPDMDPDRIEIAGNLAGSGAVMAVCDPTYIGNAVRMASDLTPIDLACSMDFQNAFVTNLDFPA